MGKRKRQNHAQPFPGTGLVPAPPYHGLEESKESRAIPIADCKKNCRPGSESFSFG